MTGLRILELAQRPQRRGAEVFAHQLSEELRRQGHQVHMVYLYPYVGEGGLPIGGSDHLLGGQEHHPVEKVPGFHPRVLRDLLRLIRDTKPQIVQANGARTVKYGAFARRLSRDRSWALIYRNIGHPKDWIRGRHYRFFYRYLVMPEVHGVIGVSKTTLKAVKEVYNLDVPMVSIPRGVAPAALVPDVSREALREQLQTTPEAPVALFVGSLTPEKRLDRLLRVIQQALEDEPDLHVWLVGDGPLRSDLETQVKEQGLADRVAFLGVQANVATYMSGADLLLLTSDTEGMPGVVLEAGLLGLPVVATQVGGLAECVRDGETGILVYPRDEERFARAVVHLLQSPAERKALGDHAQRWVRSQFTMDVVTRKYVGFYRQVLDRGKS